MMDGIRGLEVPFLYLLFFAMATLLGRAFTRVTGTPVDVVALAVARVVSRRWQKMLGDLDSIAADAAGLRWLQFAQEYLGRRSGGIYKLELERSVSRARWQEVSTPKETKVPSAFSQTVRLLALAVGLTALLIGLLALALFLLTQSPLVVLSLASVLAVLVWLITRPENPSPEYVSVRGPASDWANWQPRSYKECEIERGQVFMAITSAGEGIDTGGEGDADLVAAEETPLPAPPGITELVLKNSQESLGEIRKEIEGLRKFHRSVFLAVLVLWFLIVAVGFGSNFFLFSQAWSTSVATLGFAIVVGGVVWGFLPAVRTSHIALALYSSFQVELVQNLQAAEGVLDSKQQWALRAKAWERFRIGLNGLWLQEHRSSAVIAKLFQQGVKDNQD